MRVLIDIGHPGHVHLFKNLAHEFIKKGNQVLFTCREKEFEIELLESERFEYVSFGKHFKTTSGKIWGLVKFNYKMFMTALRFRPDIYLSHGSMYAAHVSFLLRKPHISMEDSGNMEQIRLYLPFTKYVLTPAELKEDLGKKQIRYPSYHELAYLHPDFFKPQKDLLKETNIDMEKPFSILRFVSWDATHDVKQGGIEYSIKKELIELLNKNMNVYISSEKDLPEEMKEYQLITPPHLMHHILAFADLVISEGATMASEAGVLGTTAIYVNSLERCYNEDQEQFNTVYNFRSGDGVLEKTKSLLENGNYQNNAHEGRIELLKNKINLSRFLIWFIENYPNSAKETVQNSKKAFKAFQS